TARPVYSSWLDCGIPWLQANSKRIRFSVTQHSLVRQCIDREPSTYTSRLTVTFGFWDTGRSHLAHQIHHESPCVWVMSYRKYTLLRSTYAKTSFRRGEKRSPLMTIGRVQFRHIPYRARVYVD